MTSPLVPAHSSTLFRPIATDSPWRSLLHADASPPHPPQHPQHAQQHLSKSKSISHQAPPPHIAQQPLQKSRSVTALHPPSVDHDPSQSSDIYRPVPTIVRFTHSPSTRCSPAPFHFPLASPPASTTSSSPPQTPTSHAQRHHQRQMHNDQRREQLRIRPAVKTFHSLSSTPVEHHSSRQHPDILPDLHDISSILTDRIDHRSRAAADYSRRKRIPSSSPTPGFLRRVLRRMRPTRERGRDKQRTAAMQAAANVESQLEQQLASIPSPKLAPAHDLVSLSDSEDTACWSETELRTHSRGQRDYGSFSKRNETDIDLIHARLTRPAFLRSSRYAGLRDEVPWRVARRRSMEGGDTSPDTHPTDLDDKLRECKSTVVVSRKGAADFSKRQRRARYRVRPVMIAELDRRDEDRSDSEPKLAPDSLRWKRSWRAPQLANPMEDASSADNIIVNSLCDDDCRPQCDARLRSGEHSYQSSTSSVALSVSSVTRTSRSSS